jgi:hypothetical protein
VYFFNEGLQAKVDALDAGGEVVVGEVGQVGVFEGEDVVLDDGGVEGAVDFKFVDEFVDLFGLGFQLLKLSLDCLFMKI